MRFIAWYCHHCHLYFRELELNKGGCPECGGSVIPQPMKTGEEPELLKAITQIMGGEKSEMGKISVRK